MTTRCLLRRSTAVRPCPNQMAAIEQTRRFKEAQRKDTMLLRDTRDTPDVRATALSRVSGLAGTAAGIVLIGAMTLTLGGCGGGTVASKVQVGQIAFTDANGNAATSLNALKVGSGSYLDAVVTNDPQALGINWSVTCSSALPPGTPVPPGQTVDESCGTFTAGHTATAPVPSYASSGVGVVTLYQAPAAVPSTGTVTIYAAATVDPSVRSSLTLTIIGLPISVGFAPAPPTSLALNATAQVGALVSNDSNNGGVKWSVTCASIACGSFSATQTPSVTQTTYTAPDAVPVGGTVTITATSVTDPTKFTSAAVTISQPAPADRAFAVSADSASAGVDPVKLQGESR